MGNCTINITHLFKILIVALLIVLACIDVVKLSANVKLCYFDKFSCF